MTHKATRKSTVITTENNEHRNYSTHINGYYEAAAIQELLQIMHDTIVEDQIEFEEELCELENDQQIEITIAGRTIAFYFGGPQLEALYAFCEHLASENWYSIDTEQCTVTTSW